MENQKQKDIEQARTIGEPDGPVDELDKGINPGNVPGSAEPDTLAGQPGYLAGGHFGREPKSPEHVPPYGPINATPVGVSEEDIEGSTTGGDVGSTANSAVGSTTGYLREVQPQDLPHDSNK